MMNLSKVPFFVLLLGAAFCWAGAAEASPAAQSEIRGDFGSYLQSELPNPLVLYVFTPSGSLEAYAVAHRNEGFGPLQKMEAAISAQDFRDFNTRESLRIEKKLIEYLSEQGYKIGEVVDKGKKYSLLLVIAETKSQSCITLREFQEHYEAAINNVVEASAAKSSYRLTTLILSAHVPLTCRN
jgi:hypothetical protein